jgi:hypothetical protein
MRATYVLQRACLRDRLLREPFFVSHRQTLAPGLSAGTSARWQGLGIPAAQVA